MGGWGRTASVRPQGLDLGVRCARPQPPDAHQTSRWVGKTSMAFKFKDLESLLGCPGPRTPLGQAVDAWVCLNPDCRLKYAIRDDIPIMLVDEAVKLSPEDWGAVMHRHNRDSKTGQATGATP